MLQSFSRSTHKIIGTLIVVAMFRACPSWLMLVNPLSAEESSTLTAR